MAESAVGLECLSHATYLVAKDLDLALREGFALEEDLDLVVEARNLFEVEFFVLRHVDSNTL